MHQSVALAAEMAVRSLRPMMFTSRPLAILRHMKHVSVFMKDVPLTIHAGSDASVMRSTSSRQRKWSRFSRIFPEAIENTVEIARRCNLN